MLWEAEDAEPDVVRCRFVSSLRLEAILAMLKLRQAFSTKGKAHSSLALRLRLPFRTPVAVLAVPPSRLLSSIAMRSCASSRAASRLSRLFRVERRPFDIPSASGRAALPLSFDLFECFLSAGTGEDWTDLDP